MSRCCLTHHGIFGQKWGVRRYQNKDGSYTAQGKTHKAELVKEKAEKYKTENSELRERVFSKAVEMIDAGNAASEEYTDYLKTLLGNEDFKKKVLDNVVKQSDGDIESMVWDSYDAEEEVISEMMPESVKDSLSKYRDLETEYRKSCDDYVDSFLNELDDEEKLEYNKNVGMADVLGDNDQGDRSWASFMARHFDDYWISDLDERHELSNEIEEMLYKEIYGE